MTEAQREITYISEQAIEEYIQSLDSKIYAKLSLEDNSDRATRDKDRIGVLDVIILQESQDYIIEKNRSVIQEYNYNIELWEW